MAEHTAVPTARQARLLELDPDLGEAIGADDLALARRALVVPLVTVPPGGWNPESLPARSRTFGMLVVSGLLVREVTLGDSVSAELLGSGDLIFPPSGADDADALVAADVAWTALEPTHVACLDGQFAAATRRWPRLGLALLRRSERRVTRIALTQAIGQMTRVDDRLVALLWHLSERWGRVTPQGVVLPLRLTHRVLARLIGARRPSVTTALSGLHERGLVERRIDGAWVLFGVPPRPVGSAEPVQTPWHDSRTGGPSVTRVELGPASAASAAIVRDGAVPRVFEAMDSTGPFKLELSRAVAAAMRSRELCAVSRQLIARSRAGRARLARVSRRET